MNKGPAAHLNLRSFIAPGARRSLVVMTAGVIIGLGAAGVALFTAKGTATNSLPAEDVALVNQRPILRSDFITQAEASSGLPFDKISPAARKKTLDDMLREEIFVQRGLELDLAASDPDVRSALVAGVERQVEAGVTAQTPSEAELRRAFERRRSAYVSLGLLTLHDLVPASRQAPNVDLAAATSALSALTPLAAVMARYRLVDLRKSEGVDFYFAARIHLGGALFPIAIALKNGEATGPILVGGVPHILFMERNLPPKQETFEDARDRVLKDELESAKKQVERADEEFLRRKAEIVIAPEYR